MSDRVLAFHCTRLADHELAVVRRQGLQMATPALMQERIALSHKLGLLCDDDRRGLMAKRGGALNEHPVESTYVSPVYVVLGRAMLEHPESRVAPLMTIWGGKRINGGHAHPLRPYSRIGRPTIVVVGVDLSQPWMLAPSYPALGKLFVGTLLGLEHVAADVFLRSSVAPRDVMAIWQPGVPDFDRHPNLPRDALAP